MLDVKLVSYTPNPADVIYIAAKQCYSQNNTFDLYTNEDPVKRDEFIKKIINSGHTSVIEHVSFTFSVTGLSRAASHQLVRHRIASYSQSSQRYINEKNFGYVIPPKIQSNKKAYDKYNELMNNIRNCYNELLNIVGEESKEDIRYILPQATETKIYITMNCRSLLNFFSLRCCNRAQWEIRFLANLMLYECRGILPQVFENAGAACEKDKVCHELKSCGKYPSDKKDSKNIGILTTIGNIKNRWM